MASYRLDPTTNGVLGAKLIRFIVRGENLVGRYGRRGHINGVLKGHVLTATLRDDHCRGRLTATFSEDFDRFEGFYEMTNDGDSPRGECRGDRVFRHK